jgi:hypothetical protein
MQKDIFLYHPNPIAILISTIKNATADDKLHRVVLNPDDEQILFYKEYLMNGLGTK